MLANLSSLKLFSPSCLKPVGQLLEMVKGLIALSPSSSSHLSHFILSFKIQIRLGASGRLTGVRPMMIDTTALVNYQIVTYTKIAMLTLLTYNYLLSFAREVAHIWFSKWGLVKILYLYSRYSPFIDTISAVQEQVNPHIQDPSVSCHRIMVFNTIFAAVGIGISDLILLVRTYAMYQNSRKVLAILIISWTPFAIVNIVVAFKWTSSLSEITVPVTGPIVGCLPVWESNTGPIINYGFLLGGETIVVALTVWKAFQSFYIYGFGSQGTQMVIETFYQDGILFYILILPITLGNIVVLVYGPPELQVLQTPMRVLHSTLCCKLIIHIREVNIPEEEDALDTISTIDFRAQSVVRSDSSSQSVL